MNRVLAFLYGAFCYLIFLGTFLYMIGFIGNIFVPKSIDGPAETSVVQAIFVDTLLLGLFGAQHSIMARQGFKRVWTKIVPEPIERSTYVLFTSSILLLLFWKWQPIESTVWQVETQPWAAILRVIQFAGWFIVLFSTILINHFELFGLKRVYLYLRSKERDAVTFKTPSLYRYMRHPIYFGFIVAFWVTPAMTLGHLLFALLITGYIFVGIHFEEKDLIQFFGDTYLKYKQNVSMILPLRLKR